ncbi:DNA cytosine methyltransferase [Nocardia cyriacigeorgica]|uniref:DNA cytosine methyltransferase n=1 Tax=Nocardia cyriacigeorgica TaxID=135487 RepID=UPI0034DB439E
MSEDLAQLDDVRTQLVLEPLRWALEAVRWSKPYEVIVLEQVPAVFPIWIEIGKILESYGYKALPQLLETERFGIPQTRRRAILIARLGGAPIPLRPTHRKYRKGFGPSPEEVDLPTWKSMGEALGRKDEFVVVSNYGTGGVPEARGERRHDEPAFTVTGKVSRNRFTINGQHVRNLTIDDAGILQTFPSDFPWSGKDIAQQIGNAIPPRLAAHVLCTAVFGHQPDRDALDRAVSGSWSDTAPGVPELTSRRQTTTDDAAALFPVEALGASVAV